VCYRYPPLHNPLIFHGYYSLWVALIIIIIIIIITATTTTTITLYTYMSLNKMYVSKRISNNVIRTVIDSFGSKIR